MKKDKRCIGRECLRYVNPGVNNATYGTPYHYDPTYGGCIDCQNSPRTSSLTKSEINGLEKGFKSTNNPRPKLLRRRKML